MTEQAISGNSCRVVLVSHYFPAHHGGVEIVAGMIARHLAKQDGWQVDWFASDTDAPPEQSEMLRCHPVATCNVTEYFGLPWPIWGRAGLKRLKRAIAAADVVHVHDFIYPGSIAAFYYAKRFGKPVVVTQHVGKIVYRRLSKRIIYQLAFGLLRRCILPQVDRVVFVSERVRQEFLQTTAFKAPPLCWANGVDGAMFHPVAAPAREALRLALPGGGARPVVLFVGRFVERKGLRLLHQLVKAMPDVQWWVAGRPARRRYDPRQWKEENLSVFIHCGKEQLADLYRAADLLVLPSYGEGYPLVVQEALACGTPVLVPPETAAGAPEAHAQMHTCSLQPHEDVAERWKMAINQQLINPCDEAQRQALAEFAHGQWSWEALADQYAGLFVSMKR